jgi:hypothetical protein
MPSSLVLNIGSDSGQHFHFSLGILGSFLRNIDPIFVSYSPGFRYIGGKREKMEDSGETILLENPGRDSGRKSLCNAYSIFDKLVDKQLERCFSPGLFI